MTDRLTSDTWYYQHVGGLEEYRYDALGRRVLRRFRGDRKWTGTEWIMDGEIVRYVYDGEQILYEIRMRGQDSSSAITLELDFDPHLGDPRYGTVQYTHGLALDRPLSVARLDNVFLGDGKGQTVFLHENYRGYFDKGTLSNGRRDGGLVNWRGRRLSTIPESQSPYGTGSEGFPFFGSLLDVQTDGSAQVYMRNRYYDPGTGRFTQEDPIGLAGGLNLYGFAKGDPVNFSDPFGLCPIEKTGRPCLGPLLDAPQVLRTDGNPRVGQFGMTRGGGTRPHQGIDILATRTQAIIAADKGTVTAAGYSKSYGNYVEIGHPGASGKNVSFTFYAHMNQPASVGRGDAVTAGQIIGEVGQSGNAGGTPVHLHFELRSVSMPGLGLSGRDDPAPHVRNP